MAKWRWIKTTGTATTKQANTQRIHGEISRSDCIHIVDMTRVRFSALNVESNKCRISVDTHKTKMSVLALFGRILYLLLFRFPQLSTPTINKVREKYDAYTNRIALKHKKMRTTQKEASKESHYNWRCQCTATTGEKNGHRHRTFNGTNMSYGACVGTPVISVFIIRLKLTRWLDNCALW